jgi:diphthamide biosynthesis protein 2
VGQYRQALQRVKSIIKLSGRKSYMFLIGKINPAKLLNFPEIDVFVLVACPENSLLDSKVLFKPVVSETETAGQMWWHRHV